MFNGWLPLARVSCWNSSKLPFIIAATLMLLPHLTLLAFLAISGTIVMGAAFGYGINEISDIQTDERGGKANRAKAIPFKIQISFLCCTASASMALSLVWAANFLAPLLVLLTLTLSIIYSTPPIRLKARGLAGIICGALAQWMIPILAISAAEPWALQQPITWAFSLLGFAIGLRWMAIHQLNDSLFDRAAGTRTYAAVGKPIHKLILLFFILECILIGIVIVFSMPQSSRGSAALVIWALTTLLLGNPVKRFKKRIFGFKQAPLSGYYFIVLPSILMVAKAPFELDPFFCSLAVAVGARFYLMILNKKENQLLHSSYLSSTLHICVSKRTKEKSIEEGLSFLEKNQKTNGGFLTLFGKSIDLRNGFEIKSIFDTAYIVRLIEPWEEQMAQLLKRARQFLKNEREASGVWSYFGPKSLVPPDVDDTSVALMVLNPDPSDTRAIKTIFGNTNLQGAILTWFLDPKRGPPYENTLDPCVNIHVYALLKKRSIKAPNILNYLKEILNSRLFLEWTPYYISPFFFLYSMIRLRDELDQNELSQIENELFNLLKTKSLTILESALVCTTLNAFKHKEDLRITLLDKILNEQHLDGGWAPSALYWGDNHIYHFGSRALTTAFCLEAINC